MTKNSTEGLEFPFKTVPEPTEPITVADGILWIRLPLPFALDHVNVWLIEDGDGWMLVDTGIATDHLKGIWDALLKDGALSGHKITRVLATHFHPDHIGLAGWLCARFETDLLAPRTEWQKARLLSTDNSDRLAAGVTNFYRKLGVEAEDLIRISERGNIYARRVSPIPLSHERLIDGEALNIGGSNWQIIMTPGHAPEMACLYNAERNILIAADHILPEISPNVSIWPDEPLANPLREFRQSLQKIRDQVPEDCFVLPSHGRPFLGLHERIDWLDAHHVDRLAETLAICQSPVTGKQVMTEMFKRKLDPHQWGFAMGEALAHVNYLIAENRISRNEDADQILRFTAI